MVMFRTIFLPFILTVLSFFYPMRADAELDASQLQMLESYKLVLRWDNVESVPLWVNGQHPSRLHGQGLYGVHLEPGDSVTVRVSRGEQVRIRRKSGSLVESDLDMESSLGSGLYQQLQPALSIDGHDMISRKQASVAYLARISRPQQSADAIDVILFVSRHEPMGELAPYRTVIELPGNTLQMHRGDHAAAQTYWDFKPGQVKKVRVNGPARFALENRYVYPETESALAQTYRVYVTMDGRPLTTLAFETSTESSFPVYINEEQRVMGKREVGYLEVPPGEHLLALDSTTALAARLLLRQSPDYLLPGLNEPQQETLHPVDTTHVAEISSNWLDEGWSQIESGQYQSAMETWQKGVNSLPDAQLLGSIGVFANFNYAISRLKQAGHQEKTFIVHDAKVFKLYHVMTAQPVLRDLELRQIQLASLKQKIGMRKKLLGNDAYKFKRPLLQPNQLTQDDEHKSHLNKQEAEAQYIVRDNARREGGLLGAAMMQKSARLHPDYPAVQTVANKLLVAHTYYRDLLPHKKHTVTEQFFARFIPRHLSELGEQGRRVTYGEQHVQELLGRIPGAYFNGVPMLVRKDSNVVGLHADSGYHRYVLPTRAEPSLLRLIVAESEAAEVTFFLQLDDADPIRMRMSAGQELPSSEYTRSQGDAALEILAYQFGSLQAQTSSGAYAARHTPSKLVHASLIEVPLPSHVGEIRIWRSKSTVQPIYVALQCRASKSFVMSESEYLEMASRTANDTMNIFANILRSSHPDESSSSAYKLYNHWLPLVRSLRTRHKLFIASVAKLKAVDSSFFKNTTQQLQLRSKALKAEGEGRWLSALETWSDLVRQLPLHMREQAILAQSRVLLQLGEGYLAERQLRSLALYAGSQELRYQAANKLNTYYRDKDDLDSVLSLWATVSIEQATSRSLKHLLQAMVENGKFDQALAVGLLLSESQQPVEYLLRSAYQLGWWKVYQQLVTLLHNREERVLWQGLASMSQGRIKEAQQLFSEAGKQGQLWLDALDRSQDLTKGTGQYSQPGLSNVERWHDLHRDHPGPFVWREESRLVADYAGTETIYNIGLNTYTHAYLMKQARPVILRLTGPIQLRIEARPLHNKLNSQPLDGWLHLREGEGLRLLPISNNSAASGLKIVGHGDLKPGRKVNGEFYFGPGIHKVSIDAGNLPMLLRVFVSHPEIAIPLLPPLTNRAVKQMPTLLKASLSQPVSSPAASLISNSGGQLMPWPEAKQLATGDIEAALAKHPGTDTKDALRRMILLLWWSDQDPMQHQRALIEAEALGDRFPDNAKLQSLLLRLSGQAQWQLLTSIQDSAGQRYIKVSGWQPESQGLRVRKALMHKISSSDQILFGHRRLSYFLRNLHPVQFELGLSQENVSALVPFAINVSYQLDDKTPHTVHLLPDKLMTTIHLNILKGEHVLRIKIKDPLANQFIRLHMVELESPVPMKVIERPWSVATGQEPLLLTVAGPAWLRIDELRNGEVESSYQLIPDASKTLHLSPSGKSAEALFRVYQRVLLPGLIPLHSPVINVIQKPVAQPYAVINVVEPARLVAMQDGFPLGGQEDGSWSYGTQLVRRTDSQGAVNSPTEDFLQVNAMHRYFNENKRTYFRTEILGRVRNGGTTLGLQESIEYHPLWSTLYGKLDAVMYLQNQDAGQTIAGNAWSAYLKATLYQKRDIDPKSYHVPQLTLFERTFSLSSQGAKSLNKLDQDVFTIYKSTHRQGLKLGDILYYRPWLDTMWSAGARLTTNSNFNLFKPDHLKVKVSWKQLLGRMDMGISYQINHYFVDDLRLQASNKRTWLMDANWYKWSHAQNRFGLGFQFSHDIEDANNTMMLNFIWHSSNGRGYRDFQPGEVDFRDLRKRDIPSIPNNAVKEM